MRLESLTIKNFRGIREGEIKDLVDMNILIGRNNCGKTTVVEAINYLSCAPSGPRQDPLNREPRARWREVRRDQDDAALWYGRDTSQQLELRGVVSESGRPCRYLGFGGGRGKELRPDVNEVRPHVSEDEISRSLEFLPPMIVFRPEDGFRSEIEDQVFNQSILPVRGDKTLAVAVNEIYGTNAESIQHPKGGVLTLLFESHSRALDAHGDGMRTTLRTLMMLSSRRDTLFVVEEPECHQHPGALQKLAMAMCKQAKLQRVQLLLTTHSMDCVRAFLAAAHEAGSQGAVFHLKLRDGKLESRRLERDAVENMLATGLDVRNLDLYV